MDRLGQAGEKRKKTERRDAEGAEKEKGKKKSASEGGIVHEETAYRILCRRC